MSVLKIAVCLLFAIAPFHLNAQTQPVDWVNEFIGTANEGQTFPVTGAPHAMTQWTPQTRSGNEKCIAPYYFSDSRIQGFRGSHFLSGSCAADYGSITIMPLSGALKLDATARASTFSHASEQAAPYRYAVTLSDYGIHAEMTGTTRAELLRFRFDRAGKSWLLLESNSAKGHGEVAMDLEHNEVTLINPVRRQYAGNGKPAGFSGYFVVQFDRKFRIGGTWSGKLQHEGNQHQQGIDGPPGAYLAFDLKPGETVQARVGSSFTSLAEARRNLQSEIPGWDFDAVAAAAKSQWDEILSRIQITADPTHKKIFYTALYHSMLLPRVYSDVSGTYPEFAGGGHLETAKNFTYYCDFSAWDTFRAVHPLLTLLDPATERDMVKSLIAKGEQGGFLQPFLPGTATPPRWSATTAMPSLATPMPRAFAASTSTRPTASCAKMRSNSPPTTFYI